MNFNNLKLKFIFLKELLLKQTIKKIFTIMIRFLMGLSKTNNFIRTILDIIVTQNSKKIETINIKNSQIKLYETNSITKYRNDTFFIKEPETLEWINSFEKNENFWDVGANVGLYSIYAAKIASCKVIAFEPSVFNLELLAKNIYKNSLHHKISIFPFSLSNKILISNFRNTSVAHGAALSTLENKNLKKKQILDDECSYQIPTLSLDSIVDIFKVEPPKYLKIDVDGFEYEILMGSSSILAHITSILIEIDLRQRTKSKKIFSILKTHNFILAKEGSKEPNSYTVNQIWEKHY